MTLTKIQPAGIDSSNSTLTLGTSNVTAITIDGSQNVGIGTSTAGYRLDVQSIADTVTSVKTTGSIQSAFVRIVGRQAGVDNEWNVIASGNGLAGPQLRFTYGVWTGSPSMVIDSSSNLLFNSGYGSAATAYGCRAWINYNGTGAAIRGSGNITSVTKNATGDYTFNFATAMPDVNYSAFAFGGSQVGASSRIYMEQHDSVLRSTTQIRIYSLNGALAPTDSLVMSVSFFR